VSGERRVALLYLRSLMRARVSPQADLAGVAGALDAETRARLEALGYAR
jgi:hypothetical protein